MQFWNLNPPPIFLLFSSSPFFFHEFSDIRLKYTNNFLCFSGSIVAITRHYVTFFGCIQNLWHYLCHYCMSFADHKHLFLFSLESQTSYIEYVSFLLFTNQLKLPADPGMHPDNGW